MKRVCGTVILTFWAAGAFAAQTMRVDYYHTGNVKEERFSLDPVSYTHLTLPTIYSV